MKKYKLIGAGSDLGVNINGSSLGPKTIFKHIKYSNKVLIEQDPTYQKQLDSSIKNKNEDELIKFLNQLSVFYNDALDKDEFPILIGGDHSLAISSALSSNNKQGPLGIIWFDAHADYHTHLSTTSGNMHGFPLATINGFDTKWVNKQNNTYIKEENTVIFGARSIDDGEYNNLKKTKVTLITQNEINSLGIESALNKAFNIAHINTSGVHISFDLDFLDPSIAKGVSTPVINGCNNNDYITVIKYIVNQMNIIKSFDIVEYNPLFDNNNKTLSIVIDLLDKIFNIR